MLLKLIQSSQRVSKTQALSACDALYCPGPAAHRQSSLFSQSTCTMEQ